MVMLQVSDGYRVDGTGHWCIGLGCAACCGSARLQLRLMGTLLVLLTLLLCTNKCSASVTDDSWIFKQRMQEFTSGVGPALARKPCLM
jgi:hypothetical protein